MKNARRAIVILIFVLWPACGPAEWRAGARAAASSSAQQRRVTLAVLEIGASEAGRRVASRLFDSLASAAGANVSVLDRGLAQSAARGINYAGSLNLTLREARDLGAAIGCDFYVMGDAQVIRRSSSERPAYFEAYATLFVVSSGTGRLIRWSRPAAEADSPERAEAELSKLLSGTEAARLLAAIADAAASEESARPVASGTEERGEVLDLTDGEAAAVGVREPAPYRRLRPTYTEAASRAEAEATVDVTVEIDADGRVGQVTVVRWAGFGLDEEVVETIRKMNFRPATIDGEPRASLVLLRYNFRRPARKED